MLDTGCRKACGGRLWHKAIRRWITVTSLYVYQVVRENFQFGHGDVVVAEKLWTYPVGIGGVAFTLSICELTPTSRAMDLVPGLVGLEKMATWDMKWDFTRERQELPRVFWEESDKHSEDLAWQDLERRDEEYESNHDVQPFDEN